MKYTKMISVPVRQHFKYCFQKHS